MASHGGIARIIDIIAVEPSARSIVPIHVAVGHQDHLSFQPRVRRYHPTANPFMKGPSIILTSSSHPTYPHGPNEQVRRYWQYRVDDMSVRWGGTLPAVRAVSQGIQPIEVSDDEY